MEYYHADDNVDFKQSFRLIPVNQFPTMFSCRYQAHESSFLFISRREISH